MSRQIGYITLLVRDYNEALAYSIDVLGFTLVEDTQWTEHKRWVLVSPGEGVNLLLAKAVGEQQSAQIGAQSGGRVFLFLHTDDFWRDYTSLRARGVHFEELPRHETYGIAAVFTDLYGNRWDLLEVAKKTKNRSQRTG